MSGSGIVARLTPPGRAALATLGLCGDGVWSIARELFRTRATGTLPEAPVAGRFWLGNFGAELADEVVLAVRRTEPEPWIEVHAHGGRAVIALLLELLARRGLRVVERTEFQQRVENDPLRAGAAEALTEALTVRTASILLDQYHGSLAAALTAILAALDSDNPEQASTLLDALAARAALGRHLTTPWRVVIAGAPNVGKSSLVNALAGYQRSIVAPIPGTTRDVVTTRLALDGWPADVSDTAGLRAGAEDLEAAGVALSRQALEKADLCLWVLDAAQEPVWPEVRTGTMKLVVNKTDLPPAWDLAGAEEAVRVSARTGAGLNDLVERISHWLIPDPPAPGEAVPFTARQGEGIESARDRLRQEDLVTARTLLAALLG